jgi:hypothetical protein
VSFIDRAGNTLTAKSAKRARKVRKIFLCALCVFIFASFAVKRSLSKSQPGVVILSLPGKCREGGKNEKQIVEGVENENG